MANTVYDNFYLSNEIEDQYKSHLDLQTFCTVDNTLEGTAGMLRKINVYKATDGTEKLAMGVGNSKSMPRIQIAVALPALKCTRGCKTRFCRLCRPTCRRCSRASIRKPPQAVRARLSTQTR